MGGSSYDIGYGKPPKEHRFKPGQSGNPNGRPKKKPANGETLLEVLDDTIEVQRKGKKVKMHVFEVSLRKLAEKAIKKRDLRAAMRFLSICHAYGVIEPAREKEECPHRYVPPDWDYAEFLEMLHEHGPPPWPGYPDVRLLTVDEVPHYDV